MDSILYEIRENCNPKVKVNTYLTWDEYQTLTAIANKFGLSVSRYSHDAIMQAIKDHECILTPEHQWPTD